jgi:hypothetical protein
MSVQGLKAASLVYDDAEHHHAYSQWQGIAKVVVISPLKEVAKEFEEVEIE